LRLRIHGASGILSKRFASAIFFTGDRSELKYDLNKVSTISHPSDSPDEITPLPIRPARHAVWQHLAQEKLRNLARTDDLTGLHNRQGFLELAGQQLKFASRNSQCALTLLAYVDGPKKIKDRQGHAEGDAEIIRAARILRENMRVAGSQHSRYPVLLSSIAARFDPRSPLNLEEMLHDTVQAMCEAKRTSPRPDYIEVGENLSYWESTPRRLGPETQSVLSTPGK
jgi:hypothetical protein